MEIRYNSCLVADFSEIDYGEVFEVDNIILMKIDTEPLKIGRNCIDLSSGELGFVKQDEKVRKVNCELVVK